MNVNRPQYTHKFTSCCSTLPERLLIVTSESLESEVKESLLTVPRGLTLCEREGTPGVDRRLGLPDTPTNVRGVILFKRASFTDALQRKHQERECV